MPVSHRSGLNELETVPFTFNNTTTLTETYASTQSINLGIQINFPLPVVTGGSVSMNMSFSTTSTQTQTTSTSCTSEFPIPCEAQKTTKATLYLAEMQAQCTFQGWIQTSGNISYKVQFGNTEAWANDVPIGQLFRQYYSNPGVYVDDNTIQYYVSGQYGGMRAQAWTVDPTSEPFTPDPMK